MERRCPARGWWWGERPREPVLGVRGHLHVPVLRESDASPQAKTGCGSFAPPTRRRQNYTSLCIGQPAFTIAL